MGVADTTVHPIPKPYPIPGKYVLDWDEQLALQQHVEGYNRVIKQTANDRNLAIADMNQNMKNLEPGMYFDGIKFNLAFISGGVFSTDGIHLTPKGNAQIANYFIQAINAKYGSKIPLVSVTNYHGLIFP
jgi:lysophospholipase L1-like esterase